MTPYALTLPKPLSHSCTITTFTPTAPIFILTDEGIAASAYTRDNVTADHTAGWGERSGYGVTRFKLKSDANGLMYQCQKWPGSYLNWNGTIQGYHPEKDPVGCDIFGIDLVKGDGDLVKSEIEWDIRNAVLAVKNITWTCWDKNPARP